MLYTYMVHLIEKVNVQRVCTHSRVRVRSICFSSIPNVVEQKIYTITVLHPEHLPTATGVNNKESLSKVLRCYSVYNTWH